MALKKITDAEMDQQGVCSAPDILQGTPAENKSIFDRMVRKLIAPAYNAAVDAVNELEKTESGIQEAEDRRVADENLRDEAEQERISAEAERQEKSEAMQVWEAYSSTKAYAPLNKVAWEGSSYICIQPCTGVEPGNENYWLMIARKGQDGSTVPNDAQYAFSVEDGHLILHYTGDTAPDFSINTEGHLLLNLDGSHTIDLGKVTGTDGTDGTDGVSPTVTVARNEADTGAVITAANADGTTTSVEVLDGADGDTYTLPIASTAQLGGVQPAAKTDTMTQEVGVDEAGGLWTVPGSGGGGSGAFELIDTIDWSTEEMAVANAGKEYTLSGATEIVVVCEALCNSTTTASSIKVSFNGGGSTNNILTSGKSGQSLYYYVIFRLLPGIGYTYVKTTGAINNTNTNGGGAYIPYNLIASSGEIKITKFAITNSETQYCATSGITKIYAR